MNGPVHEVLVLRVPGGEGLELPEPATAHAAGVDVLALTDHDTTDGIAEAGDEASRLGLRV